MKSVNRIIYEYLNHTGMVRSIQINCVLQAKFYWLHQQTWYEQNKRLSVCLYCAKSARALFLLASFGSFSKLMRIKTFNSQKWFLTLGGRLFYESERIVTGTYAIIYQCFATA